MYDKLRNSSDSFQSYMYKHDFNLSAKICIFAVYLIKMASLVMINIVHVQDRDTIINNHADNFKIF